MRLKGASYTLLDNVCGGILSARNKVTEKYQSFCKRTGLTIADQLAVIVPAVALLSWFVGRPSRRSVKAITPFVVQYLYETNNVDTVDVAGASWTGRVNDHGYETGTAWDWDYKEWVTILRKPFSGPKLESQVGRYDRSRYANNGRPDDSYTAKAQQAARGSYRKVIFNDGSVRFVDESRVSVPRRAEQAVKPPSGDVTANAATFSGLSTDSRSIIGDQTTEMANKTEREKRALGQNSPVAEGADSTEGEQSSETAGASF